MMRRVRSFLVIAAVATAICLMVQVSPVPSAAVLAQSPAMGSVDEKPATLLDRTRDARDARTAKDAPRRPEPRPASSFSWQLVESRSAPAMRLTADLPGIDVAAAVSAAPPVQADLLPTVDAQITPEITATIAALNNDPQAIYEFIRNGFEFQPYLGSRKGSVETLRQRAGNDYDLASLLIALLRAANIPARYAGGVVELPIERVRDWLCADDAVAAVNLLATQGLEAVAIYDGPHVVKVRCRRVWVEAYVPRGRSGAAWVVLDPAFKLHRVQSGIDVPAAMGLDAREFVDQYYAPTGGVTLPRTQTPLELLRQEIADYLATHLPGQSLRSVQRSWAILPETLGQLPASLPYKVLSRDAAYSEIPADRRYRVRFHLYDGATTLIDQTFDLPQLAGRRITIDHVPATPADAALIDAAGGLYQVSPAQVNLKPVLRVAGQDVATAAAAVGMGRTCGSDIHFLAPSGSANPVPLVSNSIICGAARAIGLAVEGVAEGLTTAPPADDSEGSAQLLYDTAMDYLGRCHAADEALARLMHCVLTTDVGLAIVEHVVKVTTDESGVPQTFEWTGLRVDADRRVLGVWPVDRYQAADPETKDFMVLAGAEASVQSHRVFEDNYGQNAVDAVKCLELAHQAGVSVYKRWSSAALPANTLPEPVRQAILAAIDAGRVVTFAADPVTAGAWSGSGWIEMDPASGAAAYVIAGPCNGGMTVDAWPAGALDLLKNSSQVTGVQLVIDAPAADSPDGSAIFGRCNDTYVTLQYHLLVQYSGGASVRIPESGSYRRTTRGPTQQLEPGHHDLTVWLGRGPGWSSLASASRKISVLGVQIRGVAQAPLPQYLPVVPAGGQAVQETVEAVVVPEGFAGTFAWSASPGIRVLSPDAATTAIEAAADTPSSAVGAETLDVTFTPTGGHACSTELPLSLTIYDVDVRAADGTSEPARYIARGQSLQLQAVPLPAGVQGTFEGWSSPSDRITVSPGPSGAQTVLVQAGSLPSAAVDAEQVRVRFRPSGAAAPHEFSAHTLTVVQLDLAIPGVPESDEENPGGSVGINNDDDNQNGIPDNNESGTVAGENDLLGLQITLVPPLPDGQVRLEMTAGANRAKLWSAATKTTAVSLPRVWTLDSDTLPETVYVEGLSTSSIDRDVTLTISYENAAAGLSAGSLPDTVRLTIIGPRKLPLGHSATIWRQSVAQIYIPTRYGGELWLDGPVQLFYTDGSSLTPDVMGRILDGSLDANIVAQGYPCYYEVPRDQWGWHYIKLTQGTSAVVESTFLEEAQSLLVPWSGWWWPTNPDINPNYYDPGQCLEKYDAVYGTSARAWEAANRVGTSTWEGHCWGWSIAAILIPQPQAVTKSGVHFTRDDMEGLYTKKADGSVYVDMSLTDPYIPDGPVTSALGEAVDSHCDDLYRILRITIREDRLPVQSDMRAIATPPAQREEVWNHAIWRYQAYFREVTGADDERLVEIDMEVAAIAPSSPPSDGLPERFEQYVYHLEFDAQGRVIADSNRQNWVSVSHYPPHDLLRLTGSPWNGGINPHVTKAKVDALYNP